MAKKNKSQPGFVLRMDPGLLDSLTAAAKVQGCSREELVRRMIRRELGVKGWAQIGVDRERRK